MDEGMDAKNLADLYGLPLVPWEQVEARLTGGSLAGTGGPDNRSWLATINPDGSPHLTGLGPLWVDGRFCFTTGPSHSQGPQPGPRPPVHAGISTEDFDLAAEVDAVPVDDPAEVADLAARWNAGGWPAEPDGSGIALTAEFSAPSAGPPPWRVYRLTPRTITVVLASAPGGATRWTF